MQVQTIHPTATLEKHLQAVTPALVIKGLMRRIQEEPGGPERITEVLCPPLEPEHPVIQAAIPACAPLRGRRFVVAEDTLNQTSKTRAYWAHILGTPREGANQITDFAHMLYESTRLSLDRPGYQTLSDRPMCYMPAMRQLLREKLKVFGLSDNCHQIVAYLDMYRTLPKNTW